MVELRTAPTPKSPKGKLDGKWDPENHTITIRNQKLGIDTIYYLDDSTGTCTILDTELLDCLDERYQGVPRSFFIIANFHYFFQWLVLG